MTDTDRLVMMEPDEIQIGTRVRADLGDLRPLRASIDALGLLHPIVITPDHRLVSGYRRLAALAMPVAWSRIPVHVSGTLEDATDQMMLAAENDENAQRRDLAPAEAERMATQLAEIYAIDAATRKGGRGKTGADSAQVSADDRKTRARAAKAVGVSHDTIAKVRAVRELTQDETAPELARAAADHAMIQLGKAEAKVSRIYHLVMATLRDEINRAKIDAIGHTHVDDLIAVHNVDFRDLDIAPESAALIFTDPPYPDEYLPMWDDLGARAVEWLAPGGMLMAYAPHKHLPRILDDLSHHLSWWWCYAVVHDGAWHKVRDRWVQSGWKPVVAFIKDGGHPAHRLPNDILNYGRKEKDSHRWQQAQAEAAYWIEAYTEPGDLVVEPFAGSGTTLAAAKELGRRGIGAEIDPSAYVTTVERVS